MSSVFRPLFNAAICSLPLLLLPLFQTAAAQDVPERTASRHWYGRISAGITLMEASRDDFATQSAFEPSLTIGYTPRGSHVFEISLGYLRSEATEEWGLQPGELPPGEAPYTISLRAIPIEAAYRYRFPSLKVGGFAPLVGLGATWMSIEDTWASDTPAESSSTSVFGGVAFLGVQADVTERIAAVAQGRYRETIDTDERVVQHMGVNGFSAQVGLQVSF